MPPDLLHFSEKLPNGVKRVTVRTSHVAALTQEPGDNVTVIHMSSGLHVQTTRPFDELLALLGWAKS